MRLRPAFAKIGRYLGSKVVHPAAHRLIGNDDSAFRQQILNVTEAQSEPDIKPDRLLDNLGREAVAAIINLGHHRWLRLKSRNGNRQRDKANRGVDDVLGANVNDVQLPMGAPDHWQNCHRGHALPCDQPRKRGHELEKSSASHRERFARPYVLLRTPARDLVKSSPSRRGHFRAVQFRVAYRRPWKAKPRRERYPNALN